MEPAYVITDQELFDKNVNDLDLSGLKCNDYPHFKCAGSISINWITFTGEHGADDYAWEYGFKLIMEP